LGRAENVKQDRFNGQKEGYLAKRGRRLGVWKPRYYVFRGGILKYYRQGKTVRAHWQTFIVMHKS